MDDASLAQKMLTISGTADNKGCQRSMQITLKRIEAGDERIQEKEEEEEEETVEWGLGALNVFRVWNRIVLAWCRIQKTSRTDVLSL